MRYNDAYCLHVPCRSESPFEFLIMGVSTQKKDGLINTYFKKVHALKPSDALLFKSASIALVVFGALSLVQLSISNSVHIATAGGTFTEGIVGTPRFINPVLAVTRADRDLTTLVYDGLMRLGNDGSLAPNIAESVTISEDGLIYNVTLKQGIYFHDNTTLTADDVLFTVNRIKDPLLSSPLRANFDGVTVEKIGDYELNFILPERYAPFIENLTFGILPQHKWKDAGAEEFPYSQHNSEPIGSGPYQVTDIVRNPFGIPEMYTLTAYEKYHRGTPKIKTIELHFFPTEEKLIEGFKEGIVQSVVGVSPKHIDAYAIGETTHHIEQIPLPRTFAVFLNQNKSPVLRDPAVRKALNVALNRQALVDTTLNGYGSPLTTPIPPGFGIATETTTESTVGIDAARDILREGGWELNPATQIWEKDIEKIRTPLTLNLATVNTDSFIVAAEFLQTSWKQLGVDVAIKPFEQSDLTQSVIRPRDYEALLFGTQLGRSLDYYSFWHSSQRNDPGLNIALYANITTDSILSELRRNTKNAEYETAMKRFVSEIEKETPALFLYSPNLLYIFPNSVRGATFTGLSEPQERLSNVSEWYIETEAVWPFFTSS